MDKARIVEILALEGDVRAITGRLARINDALKGNLLNEMFAHFHYAGVTATAPADRVAALGAEYARLKSLADEKRAEIKAILDADKRQQQALEEVAEILKGYPIIAGANYDRTP